MIDHDRTPEGGHVADVARDKDGVRIGVGDGVSPDAGHVDDDVIWRQAFGRGGVFGDVPVDQGKMGVVGVWDDVGRETDGNVAGPIEGGPRSRGPLGHRTRKGMTTRVGDGCPGTQWVRNIRAGLRMGTPRQMTSGIRPDIVMGCIWRKLWRGIKKTVDGRGWVGGCKRLIWV